MFKKLLTSILIGALLAPISGPKLAANKTEPVQPVTGEVKMYMNNLQHTGVSDAKGVDNFTEVKWKFKTNGRIYASPIVNNDVAYVGSNDNNFYAVNINTGEELWKFETKGAVNSTAAIYDNKAYFASADGYFYAVSIKDGKLIWKFKTKGEKTMDDWDFYLSSPAIYNGTVYFGSGDSNIYALNADTGKTVWKHKTEGIVHASPAINNDTLYCGSYDGNMYALNVKDGKLKWKFKTVGDRYAPEGEIQGSATIANGMVYFGSRDTNMYALNEEDGKGMWNFKESNSWIISTPSTKVVNKRAMLYFGTSDSYRFGAVSAIVGEQAPELKWSSSTPLNIFSGTTLVGDIGYFGCFDGRLYAVDLVNKKVLWTYQTEASKINHSKVLDENDQITEEFYAIAAADPKKAVEMILDLGSILSTPTAQDGVLYFGSADGYLYAVK